MTTPKAPHPRTGELDHRFEAISAARVVDVFNALCDENRALKETVSGINKPVLAGLLLLDRHRNRRLFRRHQALPTADGAPRATTACTTQGPR